MDINPLEMMKHMNMFQEKLAGISETGSAGGGMVEIEINGKFEVMNVQISKEAAGDTEMLGDLVMAAFSDAMEKVRDSISREMGSLAGGLNIPGLSGLMGNL